MNGTGELLQQRCLQTPRAAVSQGLHWQVLPEYADVFFGPAGLRLPEWLEQGQAVIVKKGPHRVVYRVELPEVSFYLKHNLVCDTRSWLRQLFRPSKARMEYNKVLEVAARGVPTVTPLALGECRRGRRAGESYFLTRSLEQTIQLNDFLETLLPDLPPARHTTVRQRLAEQLGLFIAHLHDAGILHNDLHCGNILIHLDEQDHPILYLIDLQAVRLGRPLSWPRRAENLVMLNRWLTLRASRTDRLRFWHAYLSHRRGGMSYAEGHPCLRQASAPSLPASRSLAERRGRQPFCPGGRGVGGERVESRFAAGRLLPPVSSLRQNLADSLEKKTRLSNEQFWRRRERRCLAKNRHNYPVWRGDIAGYVTTDLDRGLVERLWSDPDAPFRDPQARLLKNSRSTTVVEMRARVGGQTIPVICKRFLVTKWYTPLLNLLRSSAALRSWIFGHSLRERALPTARPLAVLHRCRWGLVREGYLLMEKVENQGDLKAALERWALLPAGEFRHTLRWHIEQLARLLRQMHARHLAHRDLKGANLLVRADDAGWTGAGQAALPASPFCFIDLVGVSRGRRLARSRRVKNLARLHASFCHDPRVTRTDKLRFLRTYLQWGLRGRHGWKDWWRAIEAATQTKIRKNQRNGRPLG